MGSALINKIDKVVQGLTCCQNTDNHGCAACPYLSGSAECLSAAIDDALEVIRKLRGMVG